MPKLVVCKPDGFEKRWVSIPKTPPGYATANYTYPYFTGNRDPFGVLRCDSQLLKKMKS